MYFFHRELSYIRPYLNSKTASSIADSIVYSKLFLTKSQINRAYDRLRTVLHVHSFCFHLDGLHGSWTWVELSVGHWRLF